MTPEYVTTSREGAALIVVLDRPDQRNALTHAMYQALADAIAKAEDDPSIIAVIIAANGPGFCAGNDLSDFLENPPADGASPVGKFLRALSGSSKVTVAAVQGDAVGVGATMLLHCDHVVAAQDARLHFSFVKIGLVPEAASSLLLPRAVGALRAAELLLTGEPVNAADARALGLVSRLVPVGAQLDAAKESSGASRRIRLVP